MKKTKKKLLFTAVTTMVACTLSTGLVMTAFADEATKDHEFDSRNGDVVFEDFDRESLEGVVSTTTAALTDIGVKPYLHVEFEAMPSDVSYGERNGWIYKQGSGSIAKVKDGGAIRITMRAPENDVDIGDLCFGVRGGADGEDSVLVKSFSELADSDGDDMPALSDSWVTYEINFAMSYEDEIYPTTTIPVTGEGSADLTGFHIFPAADVDGTVDIKSVEYKTTGTYQYLNDFTGGNNVQDTAKAIDSATWWAGSDNGAIVKRMPTLTNGGDLLVVKESAVGKYAYAVIEAEGDVEHLKVATTTDGTTFGDPVAYDGYSVALTGEEKGFKFTYDGEENVKIKRIYLTNLEVVVPDTATPVIDAKSAKFLDDFSVAQSGFSGDYDAMVAATEAAGASNMYFRLSYSNGDKVNIKDGALVFDEMPDGFTQLKFNSKTLHTNKYVVLKMKLEGEGANLDQFRFALIGENDATTDVVWSHSFKSGVEYNSRLLDNSNPYKDGDWHYVIIDIDESGFAHYDTGYSGMDMYYGGAGKLYIDEIFFADKLDIPDKEYKTTADGAMNFAGDDATYAGSIGATNDGTANVLSFDITPATEEFNVAGLRLVFDGIDGAAFWGADNPEGTLITTDGKKLSELTFTAGEAKHIEIDLAASKIGAFTYMHAHCDVDTKNAFVLNNVAVSKFVSVYDEKTLDTEHPVAVDGAMNFAGTDGTYAGSIGATNDGTVGVLAFDITAANEAFDVAGLRLVFDGIDGAFWGADNPEGTLITTDGKKLSELTFTAGEATHIEIDLAASNIGTFTYMHAHCDVTTDNAFVLNNVSVIPYKYAVDEYYAQQLDLLPLYLDSVAPTVSITNETTATAGDEITIAYTASDNATSAADLKVEITVTKDGETVTTLEGNKFTAEEGVYTITVKVTDVAGNEATDVKQITVAAKATETPDNGGGKKLSAGAIAGIVIGCVAGVGLIAVGAFFLVKYLRKKKGNKGDAKADKKEDENKD